MYGIPGSSKIKKPTCWLEAFFSQTTSGSKFKPNLRLEAQHPTRPGKTPL